MSGPSRRTAPPPSSGPARSTETLRAPATRSISHGAPAHGLAARAHAPAAPHSKMAAKRHSTLEVEQEVLADRLDSLQPPAVEPPCDVQRRGSRMRRLDLDPLPDERLQPPGGAMDAVALGQAQSSPERPRPRPRPRP